MAGASADYNVIRGLAQSAVSNLNSLGSLNDNLLARLKHLGLTFEDDGIEIITDHINRTKTQIDNAFPDFNIVIRKLKDSADKLEDSDNIVKRT